MFIFFIMESLQVLKLFDRYVTDDGNLKKFTPTMIH